MTSWIDYGRFQTRSPIMHEILREAEKAAMMQASVFVHGEPGTGRRTLARWMHDKSLHRSARFLTWTPEQNLRLQEGDTVLIENIHEASPASLLKIRQTIEEFSGFGVPRVRWIITSQFEAKKWMESSSLARDLAYRLCVMNFRLPTLQERGEDIAQLASLFLQVCCLVNSLGEKKLTAEAVTLLQEHAWVGHVAELNNVIERAALYSKQTEVTVADFLFLVPKINEPSESLQLAQAGMTLFEMEKKLIFQTLEMTRQNKTRAAQILGISIRTLRNKLNVYRMGGSDVQQHVR